MAKPMTKAKTVATLARQMDMPKRSVEAFLDALADLAYKEARHGFVLPGFGKLVVREQKARVARNPKTGEPIHVPRKRVLKFRIAKAAKDAVLGAK
jgi:DNA-binding protein HU-beta